MNMQQLRCICEVVQQDLNLSKVAKVLFTSQPGVSRQVLQLEDELGVKIFVRSGKRLVGVTEPGQEIIRIAQRMLADGRGMKEVRREFGHEATGELTIATTHTQARYVLPPVIKRFMKRYPHVKLSLRQGNPHEIAQMTINGQADFAVATEAISLYEQLVSFDCYQWNRCVLVLPGHPLLKVATLTLEELARHPIITYDLSFAGRSRMDKAFAAKGIVPNVALAAIDADVIKTYVRLGLGVGVVAEMAYSKTEDRAFRRVEAAHLFDPSVTRLGIRRHSYLRGYTYDFIEMFAPHLARAVVSQALHT
ncbi:MAG: CysB family HTH-type transcriptional regulator [Betaproteobacteria bacterium]|nr:CysB family HTH-type transcriptional regulator [Betaproteobacteria bacterium]